MNYNLCNCKDFVIDIISTLVTTNGIKLNCLKTI